MSSPLVDKSLARLKVGDYDVKPARFLTSERTRAVLDQALASGAALDSTVELEVLDKKIVVTIKELLETHGFVLDGEP